MKIATACTILSIATFGPAGAGASTLRGLKPDSACDVPAAQEYCVIECIEYGPCDVLTDEKGLSSVTPLAEGQKYINGCVKDECENSCIQSAEEDCIIECEDEGICKGFPPGKNGETPNAEATQYINDCKKDACPK